MSVFLVLAGLAIGVYGIDQLTKVWVVDNLEYGVAIPVIGDFLQFYFVRNPGAAFSLASGSTWIFSILAAAVVVFIIWYSAKLRSLGWAIFLGLLLGGVLGNLNDRLFREPGFGRGHVVDFISTPWMLPAIYNVADIAIVSAMGVFVILTFRGIKIDGTREPRSSRKNQSKNVPTKGTAVGGE
ncbi:signal peptidase II [Lysinibacter sp. HNR]|uniref:signal peptidase II n=1 Tax=Lysinibacter sp. HNR TaxID=3031408 RepID=UPI002435B93C|nr:signal peptidase II [Lysinibacter sp. HNR]WGD36461.1 signal peptidase II [Lysinibacter sp. HNR]